ncbi:MAG: ferritin-like domain-containing protein [Pseudonocardiales bacterium]|nr:ferritin-like domain-containing protein [Pseudonocardiales bacterium]
MDTRTVTPTLITQLRALEQLTRTEEQVARVRVSQARTAAVQRELEQNAANAARRATRLRRALDDLDAVPDVITPAIGRVLALVKATVEQAQPVDEALLGDLTLEHQLLDRARYVRTLARDAHDTGLERLADDLVEAHTATVDWLTTVLAEHALGGVAALTPTPLQKVAGGVTRVVSLPTRFAVEQFNRAVATVTRTGEKAREGAEEFAGTVTRIGADAAEVAAAGRDAALARAERVARRDGADATAGRVHTARRDLGALSAAELPIPGYEGLTAPEAIAAVRELGSVDDVTAVVAFEEQHKNRSGVVSAAQTHVAALAKDEAGV